MKRMPNWLKIPGQLLAGMATLATFLSAPMARAATNTWQPAGGTNDWFEPTNWSSGFVPTNGDDVVINPGASTNWVMLTNSTYALASILLTNKCTLIFSNWDSKLSATNVNIMTGAVVTLPAAFSNDPGKSNNIYIFCSNLTVGAWASIDADNKGYKGNITNSSTGYGPGGGYINGGGSYGGRGGGGYGYAGIVYGDPAAPIEPGSAGGAESGSPVGGPGGGAIRIEAIGEVTVNGTITARGWPGSGTYYGSGSGGGVYIVCNTITGNNGIVRATGGTCSSRYAGGGGRIAVIYNTNAQVSIPSILFNAAGGWDYTAGFYGDPGTLYFPNNLFLSNTFLHSGYWSVPGLTNWAVDDLIISNGWLGFSAYGFQLTVTNNLSIIGTNLYQHRLELSNEAVSLTCGGNIFLTNAAIDLVDRRILGFYRSITSSVSIGPTLTCGGNLTLTNNSAIYVQSGRIAGESENAWGALLTITGDVSITRGATLYLYAHPTNGGAPLIRLRNLAVGTGATINANGRGFDGRRGPASVGYGPGAGSNTIGGGYGGHGGPVANTNFGLTYGNSNAPIYPGSAGGAESSGGYGAVGGGAIRIVASQTMTIDGTLTADGGSALGNYYGGGSGGAIYLRCRTFRGSTIGLLSADGSAGTRYGSGGGRIAVWRMYEVSTGAISNTVEPGAAGGGYTPGTNGTVVWGWIPVPGTIIKMR